MKTIPLQADIRGIGVLGPGLSNWSTAAPVLAGGSGYFAAPVALPVPESLPAAERRRTGRVVKLAIAVGLEAAAHAQVDPKTPLTVFSSSAGDGDNCHEILQTLASSDRQLSPTRFHNSVHNAPAGYWSIATGAMTASTALCAHDGSFAAGLLEAMAQVNAQPLPVLLIAYDCGYPSPLAEVRPIPAPLGIGLLLTRSAGTSPIARISVRLGEGTPNGCDHPQIEALRANIPAGRALPLLAALARRDSGTVVLDYLERLMLLVDVVP